MKIPCSKSRIIRSLLRLKILMNSFYGVLGSPGCRFFSPDIAQAITGTGQYILKTTSAYIEEHTPHKVIYGDTDSLFVLLGPEFESEAKEIGANIIKETNVWLTNHCREKFNTDSFLELEFETHFRHFFMPTIRGSSQVPPQSGMMPRRTNSSPNFARSEAIRRSQAIA